MAEDIKLDKTVKYVRDNSIVSSDMDGDTVMMSLEMNKYFGMNPVGSDIWELLTSPKTFSEICSTLLEKYDVQKEQCESDVEAFMSKMLTNKLIVKEK